MLNAGFPFFDLENGNHCIPISSARMVCEKIFMWSAPNGLRSGPRQRELKGPIAT